MVEKIRRALERKHYVCGINMELQKAFDTVNHSILLDKLSYYGVRGQTKSGLKIVSQKDTTIPALKSAVWKK